MTTSRDVLTVDLALLKTYLDTSHPFLTDIDESASDVWRLSDFWGYADQPHVDIVAAQTMVTEYVDNWRALDSLSSTTVERLKQGYDMSEIEVIRLGNSPDYVSWPGSRSPHWDDFTEEEQREILVNLPELILTTDGVPAEIRTKAWEEFYEELEERIPVEETGMSAKVEVEIPLWVLELSLEYGFSATATEYANGRIVLALELSGELGVEIANTVGGGVAAAYLLKYEFDNQLELTKFFRGMQEHLLSPGRASDYLHKHSALTNQVASIGLYVEMEAEAGLLNAEFEVGGGVGYDFKTEERHLYFYGEMDLEFDFGAVEVDLEAAVEGRWYKGVDTERIVLSGNMALTAELGRLLKIVPESLGGGGGVELLITLDLEHPPARAAWNAFLRGGEGSIGQLYEHLTISGTAYGAIQTDVDVEVNAAVVEVDIEIGNRKSIAYFHKAPGMDIKVIGVPA